LSRHHPFLNHSFELAAVSVHEFPDVDTSVHVFESAVTVVHVFPPALTSVHVFESAATFDQLSPNRMPMQEIATDPLIFIVGCQIAFGTAETVAIPFRIPAALDTNPPRQETEAVPFMSPLEVLILIAAAETVAAPDKLAEPSRTR
jgi:hypothetical protein